MPDSLQKISFVIPAYNCADTLEEAVDSIFNGNFEEGDEVIIVNDASTDQTGDVITRIQTAHPSVIALANAENKGCPASRNVGIRRARNPLIFNLDGDNILVPGSVRKLKDLLVQEGADIAAFSEYHFFKTETNNISHKWIFLRAP